MVLDPYESGEADVLASGRPRTVDGIHDAMGIAGGLKVRERVAAIRDGVEEEVVLERVAQDIAERDWVERQ